MELFKKLEVPDELPDLDLQVESVQEQEKPYIYPEKHHEYLENHDLKGNENGFFKEILEKVESDDTPHLEELNQKFSHDLLGEMKEYWEKQKSAMLIGPGKELKQKLLEKIHALRTLEKEWQEVYFNLLEKEEKIKAEEAELKTTLAEFTKLHEKEEKITR